NGSWHKVELPHKEWVTAVGFLPNGTALTACRDGKVRFWSADGKQDGSELLHTRGELSMTISRDGKFILTGCEDGPVHLWATATREELAGAVADANKSGVNALAIDRHNERILVGRDDGTIQLWEGGLRHLRKGPVMQHDGRVNTVLFTSGGDRIVSASAD